MRNLFVWMLVIACLFVFIGGGILVYLDPRYKDFYIVVTSIVGGFASVFGLIGLLASRRMTGADIKDVEADLFKQLADTKERADKYTIRATETKEEMDRLQRDRAELEVLIRQASLKVFLEERLRAISEEIERKISSDHNLAALISDYEATASRVKEISGTLSASPKADYILDILKDIAVSDRAKKHLMVSFAGAEFDIAPALRKIVELTESLVKKR